MTTKATRADRDKTLASIQCLTRDGLLHELTHFKGAVQLDFSEEFLAKLSDEKLRHVLLAAFLHGRPYRMPGISE